MFRCFPHLVQHLFEAKQRPPTGRASHIFHHRFPQAQRLQNAVANGDFLFGGFRQGNADRVADPFRQQGGNPGGGLDPTIVAIARFRHAQMDRVGHPGFVQPLGQ